MKRAGHHRRKLQIPYINEQPLNESLKSDTIIVKHTQEILLSEERTSNKDITEEKADLPF